MAKRSRGTNRPGQQRPTRRPQRPAGRPGQAATAAAGRPSGALTTAEEERAAELEAQILAQERGSRRASSGRSRDADAVARSRSVQPSGLLAARAAEEYGYVVRDVRRIAIVAGLLLLAMIVLYVLIEVLHVGGLG